MKNISLLILILYTSLAQSQGEPPWRRPLKICSSIDGISFSNIQTFQDSSGVPCIVKDVSGRLISAFQWFRQPVGSLTWDRVAVKFSTDNGISWTTPVPIVINGLPTNFQRPFDPTLAITDSGRIRIYFSSGQNMVPDSSINTYSAISDDGINYTMDPGFRFSMPDRPVVDPAVIKFRNLWHLANPVTMGIGAYHNISNDGLNFTRVQDINSDMNHTWIGNFMIEDTSTLRFYGSGMSIWYSASTNGGTWGNFVSTNVTGGDPAVLKLSAANYIMIYTGQPYPSSIGENESYLKEYKLYQNFPNPFNPETVINFRLSDAALVIIKVYDVSGVEIATLLDDHVQRGNHSLIFNGTSLASGLYFCKMFVVNSSLAGIRNFYDSRKMLLLK